MVFVIDFSITLRFNVDDVIEFVQRMLLPADIDSGDVRIGLLLFATYPSIQFHLNEFDTKKEVFENIKGIKSSSVKGSTNTADALKTMNDQMFTELSGDRPNVQNIGIVLTDGRSTLFPKRVPQEAERAKLNGIHIFAIAIIGIGDFNTDELKTIASIPASQNAFMLKSFAELRVFDEIFLEFCPGMICLSHNIRSQLTNFTMPLPIKEKGAYCFALHGMSVNLSVSYTLFKKITRELFTKD